MKHFTKILFVIQETDIHDFAFAQASHVVKGTQAAMDFLVLAPKFSAKQADTKSFYEDKVRKAIQEHSDAHGLAKDAGVTFSEDTPHFMTAIKHVINKKYDLVIKAAENIGEKKRSGFRSLDMNLVRKCPVPVWLCKDIRDGGGVSHIMTAVDPLAETQEGRDLNLKILEIGTALSGYYGAKHTVISCWSYEYEGSLSGSAFFNTDSGELEEMLERTDNEHNLALQNLLKPLDLGDAEIVRQKGDPSDVIPSYIDDQAVDLVVMGTVARTGIPGFVVGNTAENILQNITSGVLAAKPDGFVSPVKG